MIKRKNKHAKKEKINLVKILIILLFVLLIILLKCKLITFVELVICITAIVKTYGKFA